MGDSGPKDSPNGTSKVVESPELIDTFEGKVETVGNVGESLG